MTETNRLQSRERCGHGGNPTSTIPPNNRAQGEGDPKAESPLEGARQPFAVYAPGVFSNVRRDMAPIEKVCCFTGHRPKYFAFRTNENDPGCIDIKAFLRDKCEYLITEKNVVRFISGGAVGVDTWAMEAVITLKKKHCHIKLECALPYAGMPARFAPEDQERYARIKPCIDIITELNQERVPGCMQQRNEYMVDRALYVIAVWTGQKSGTGNIVHYAKKLGRTVFHLNPSDPR